MTQQLHGVVNDHIHTSLPSNRRSWLLRWLRLSWNNSSINRRVHERQLAITV